MRTILTSFITFERGCEGRGSKGGGQKWEVDSPRVGGEVGLGFFSEDGGVDVGLGSFSEGGGMKVGFRGSFSERTLDRLT